eukprot:TRINITY_DN2511_c0_g1_i3.p1 TRINITY_DN2511_c0_g1~~TRINITY_DN2511_c0_g1_i3.p1  ORF type:complete len:676 (-),score=43.53 TRINITY_DN2511_c0_g1_i3:182-1996(-)
MVDAAAQKLLDFSQPLDVPVLDSVVTSAYGGAPDQVQRQQSEKVLKELQDHPQAWTRVVDILERSQNESTRYFGLQILENVVKFRWGALPDEQRQGIKTYIPNLIISISSNPESFRKQRMFLAKVNIILVQVLKQDWPSKWQSFIPELVQASKTSETLCENSMCILRLLSEEVFDFNKGELTQAKTKELKGSLNNQFQMIYELCHYVLTNSQKVELIQVTLDALAAYLTWIPLGFILESDLLELILRFFPHAQLRNQALKCLTEAAGLQVGNEYALKLLQMYMGFMSQLTAILPLTADIATAYVNGSQEDQDFVMNLALFFTSFFKYHVADLEQHKEYHGALQTGMEYLIRISFVDNIEIFKTCLDYWNYLVADLYSTACAQNATIQYSFVASNLAKPSQNLASIRKDLYQEICSRLRTLMITRMAKPEEVIVVEDDNGNIVRETMKDNDVLAQYKTMRETLIFLSHLDHRDTERQMQERLKEQTQLGNFNWNQLNCLCWAIGSISGSMAEEQENHFLVMVIRDLLGLCEQTKGKDNKAVIASNIMYVVGQYPRFLQVQSCQCVIVQIYVYTMYYFMLLDTFCLVIILRQRQRMSRPVILNSGL